MGWLPSALCCDAALEANERRCPRPAAASRSSADQTDDAAESCRGTAAARRADGASSERRFASASDVDVSSDGGASADETVLLGAWLKERGVTDVDVVGIATDHCVRATALDAQAQGFTTRVLLDHCAGVAPDTTAAALEEMTNAGIEVV